ncbi:MAG TPA: DUF3303 family protein [Candidatus Acidoferrales bacterium]|nr:DUF3303 family protein [Candidatus Acidoferrales bacterium]
MRVMLRLQIPAATGNAAIKDGRLGHVLGSAFERIKPESAYFSTVDGDRGGYIVFDLAHPNDIPSICEPFFAELGAKIEIMPVMTADDVQAGLSKAFPS